MSEQSWQYVAETRAGKVVRGQMAGTDEFAVLHRIKSDGLRVLSLAPGKGSSTADLLRVARPKKLPIKVQARLYRSLADLTQSGIELSDALKLLISRESNPQAAEYLVRLNKKVRAGTPLSSALQNDPIAIQPYVASLIEAGETTGSLAKQLSLIADTIEAQQKMRSELIAQLIYPVSLCVLIILTIAFLSFVVLPQFESIFLTADAVPPAETRFVLALGSSIRQFGAFLPAVAIGVVILGMIFSHQYGNALSTGLLRLPLLGSIKKKLETTRYTRVLGAMLSGGARLSIALPIAMKAVTSPALQARYRLANDAVRSGAMLSNSLADQRITGTETLQLIEIGEKSGRLGEMLLKAAQLCEADVTGLIKKITSLAGPALTALMGLITAAVIAAIMSGVLSLNDAIYG